MKVSVTIPLSREALRKLNQMAHSSELGRGKFVEQLIEKEWVDAEQKTATGR